MSRFISFLRRAQLSEPVVRYFAAAVAVAVILGVIAVTSRREGWSITVLWIAPLMFFGLAHLFGLRTAAIVIVALLCAALCWWLGTWLALVRLEIWVAIVAAHLVLLIAAGVFIRSPRLAGALAILGGLSASGFALLPFVQVLREDTDWKEAVLFSSLGLSPLLLANVFGKLEAHRSVRGSLFFSDLRDALFRIVGLSTAVIAAIGASEWVTVHARTPLVSTKLESAIAVLGWCAGGIVLVVLVGLVWRLPAAACSAQFRGRLFPGAIAESAWFVIFCCALAVFFDLSEALLGIVTLVMLGMLCLYCFVRLALSAPLPAGQAPLWIVMLSPATRLMRKEARRLANVWKMGPTILLAPPDAAQVMADAHLRACIKTRTLDRLFPLRPAHLADWDQALPPPHAWHALRARELYADPKLWAEILASRLTPKTQVVALGAGVGGSVVAAPSNALGLEPGLTGEQLESISGRPVLVEGGLKMTLSGLQYRMRFRRTICILHDAADRDLAWQLHASLCGAIDRDRHVVRPYVIRQDCRALPLGFGAPHLRLLQSIVRSINPGFIDSWLGNLLWLHGAPEDVVRDLVVIDRASSEPPQRVHRLFANLLSHGAFSRFIVLHSAGSLSVDAATMFRARMFGTVHPVVPVSLSTSPNLATRVSEAAQKLLELGWDPVKRTTRPPEPAVDTQPNAPSEELSIKPATEPSAGTANVIANTEPSGGAVQLSHDQPLVYAAFSPDDTLIVTTSRDHTASLWDAHTGAHTRRTLRHDDTVRHAAFDPRGEWIATVGSDQTLRVWERVSGREVLVLRDFNGPVVHVAFDPSGERVAVSCGLKASIFELPAGQVVAEVQHEADVVRCEFSPNGGRILTCSHDNTARIWEAASGAPIGAEMRHVRAVNYATFSPDGRLVVTASSDGSARLWDAHTCTPLGQLMKHDHSVVHAAFSPIGRLVVTSGFDNCAKIWEASDATAVETIVHPARVRCAAYHPQGKRLATACDDGRVRVYGSPGAEVESYEAMHRVSYVAWSPRGDRLIAIDESNSAKLWTVSSPW